jgi:hypothetical protein
MPERFRSNGRYADARQWTAAEDKILGTKIDREIADLLGRTRSTVRIRRQKLGIAGAKGKVPNAYSDAEVTAIDDETLTNTEVARLINRTRYSVTTARKTRGLKAAPSTMYFQLEQKAAVFTAIRQGLTLEKLQKDKVVSGSTVRRWLKQEPRLQQIFHPLIEKNAVRVRSEASRLRWRRPIDHSRILGAVTDATRSLPPSFRDEVANAMTIAMMEGEFPPERARAMVDEFRKRHFRMFGNYGPRSLDAQIGHGEGSFTLLDTLDSETFHF